jgi:hypothetical protein
MDSSAHQFTGEDACVSYAAHDGAVYALATLHLEPCANQPFDGLCVNPSGSGLKPGSVVTQTLSKNGSAVREDYPIVQGDGTIDTSPIAHFEFPCVPGNVYSASASGTSADSLTYPKVPGIAMPINLIEFKGIEFRIFFIMVMTTLPAFTFQILDAFRSMSKDLFEMTVAFRPSRWTMFRVLVLPTVVPGFLIQSKFLAATCLTRSRPRCVFLCFGRRSSISAHNSSGIRQLSAARESSMTRRLHARSCQKPIYSCTMALYSKLVIRIGSKVRSECHNWSADIKDIGEAQVAGHGAREQVRLLRHQPHAAAQDVGRALNPQLVHGQIEGGGQVRKAPKIVVES